MSIYRKSLNVSAMRIRTEDILRSMMRDELFYVYIHTAGRKDFIEAFPGYRFPLNMEELCEIKKATKYKKIKSEALIEDIILCLKNENLYKEWFNVNALKGNMSSDIIDNIFTVTMNSLFRSQCDKEFEQLNEGDFKSVLEKMIFVNIDENRIIYMCLKFIYLLYTDMVDSEIASKLVSQKSFQEAIYMAVNGLYFTIAEKTLDKQYKMYEKSISKLDKYDKDFEKNKVKIRELNDNIKLLKKQSSKVEKWNSIVNMECILGDVGKIIRGMKEDYLGLDKKIESMRYESVKTVCDGQLNRMMTQMVDVKSNLMVKTMECKELRKTIEEFDLNIEDKFKEYVRVNGLSSDMRSYMELIMQKDNNVNIDELGDIDEVSETEQNERPLYRIGYVSIENGVHMITYKNGATCELLDIPDRLYLGENQFVIADAESRLKKSTSSVYIDNGIPMSGLMLGTVTSISPLKVRIGIEEITLKVTPVYNNGCYVLNQVVGLNSQYNIVRAFKVYRFTLDSVMSSIKAKELTVYYVLKVMQSGLYLREVVTGEEDFYKLDLNGCSIKERCLIFEQDGVVKNVLEEGRVYTSSKFYDNKGSNGVVEIKNDEYYIKKQTGEVAIIKNIPHGVELIDGQVIVVDEFDNFLKNHSMDCKYVDRVVSKKTAKEIAGSVEKRSVEMVGEVTIVGNVGYRKAYAAAFQKEGYFVNMLDGFNVTSDKVIQVAKNSTAVFVTTSYSGHGIYWEVKDRMKAGELPGVKFFGGNEDGANMLVRKLLSPELVNNSNGSIMNS